MEQAYTRWNSICFPTESNTEDGEKAVPFSTLELGLRYNNSPAIVYAEGESGEMYEDPFWPTAEPGSRAPHVWFRRGNAVKSLYDYLDTSIFTLLCSERGTAWLDALEILQKKFPVRAGVVPLGEFFSKYKIRDSGAVLVRPDGIIAWKVTNDSDVEILGKVLKKILGSRLETEAESQIPRSNTAPEITVLSEKIKVEDQGSPRKGGSANIFRRMAAISPRKK